MIDFIDYGVPLLSEAYAAGLERQRQKVLESAWRPSRCVVPWTPAEESDYRAMNPHLHAEGKRQQFRAIAASGIVERELAEVANVVPFPGP